MTDNAYEVSVLFKLNYTATKHIVINQGGTSSGKTYALVQVLFCLACQEEKQVITVVGQDIPNLKAGALRDALNISEQLPQHEKLIKSYNRTDRIFEFYNGSTIEFKSYDTAQDAKSGKRDYLFINEANGIEWNIYNELAMRTKTRIFIDYNPNAEFWVHDRLIGRPDVALIISDHRHNPFLDKEMAQRIESIQDPEKWKVYARGLTGKVEGLVFDNWFVCDDIPPDAKLIATGLDFGFSNDETGCIDVYRQNGELWIDELFYETHLTNTDVSKRLALAGVSKKTEIVADSAEPKSIEELWRLGWNIVPAKKGPDSVNNSIDILKRYTLNITRRSTNLHTELSRYKWKVDKSGRALNEPVDTCNHLIDPLRYVALNKLNIKPTGKIKSRLPVLDHQPKNNLNNLLLL